METPIRLKSHVINGHHDGPHLLITAGVHGDEFEGIAAVGRLAANLKATLSRGRVTLVPVVNEAAYARGARTADDDLDLARTCPGRPEGSITVRLAHAPAKLIQTADYYIDLHSGGVALRVAPLVGYMMHPEINVLETQRRIAIVFNLPLIWGTSAMLEGRTLSVARDANIPAIYAEYQGGGACSSEGVQDYYQGCVNVLAELGMLQTEPVVNRVEWIVEDARPNSGHLQICHPAPVSGLFSAAVDLMQEVSAGDVLGWLSDPHSGEVHEIHSEQNGFVITMASFARVTKGDGLAVVMETQANGVTCRRP